MGELADKAKKMSKFLKLDMNETVVAKFVDYRAMPSNFDPEKETIQYELEIDGDKKFWSNGSTYVMLAFDKAPKGSLITITRKPMLDKKGNVVEGKSSYTVEPFDGKASAPPPTTTDDDSGDNPF